MNDIIGSCADNDPLLECLLALEQLKPSDFPAERKIPPRSLLLAFILANTAVAKSHEARPLPEIFISELKQLLAAPRPPSTHEIIDNTQKAIDDLRTIKEGAPLPKMAALSFTLIMLKAKLRKEARYN